MNTFTYKLKIPEQFSLKNYDFIFIGFEDDQQNLIKRIETKYTKDDFYQTLDNKCHQIVFLGFLDGKWDDIRIELNGDTFLYNKFKDLILPKNVPYMNVEMGPEEFNKRVTVIFIDEGHEDELEKIIYMYNSIGITNIKIINSKTVDMKPITCLDDYDTFAVKELYKYVDTEFCLISQWDGFILNYNKIKREFFRYDYVGAPFYLTSGDDLGNGGFSLRSKKFLDITAEMFKDCEVDEQEDAFYQKHIDKIKKAGLTFAPFHTKDAFSIEQQQYSGQFGFHGYMTKGLPPVARQFYKNKFHHSGDLGDIIFSLPTMRALGGGILVVTNNIEYFIKRENFEAEILKQLRNFLRKQDYIVEVYLDHRIPYDIDYDLNKFRLPQLLHKTGQLQGEDLEKFENEWPNTTITQLHFNAFDIDKNEDIEPWLKWNKKTVYDKKPIIINRTERYHNDNFPWESIVGKYGKYIYFVGNHKEYKDFISKFGYVDYLQTPDIISLVETIIGSKLLIGNMSFPVALAEGFKHNCLVESGVDVRSNNYIRHNICVPNPDNIDKDEMFSFIKEYVGF